MKVSGHVYILTDPSFREDWVKKREVKRASFKFSMCDIKIGELITFIHTGIQVKVASNDSIEYEGRIYKVSPFVSTFMPEEQRNTSGVYQGAKYFLITGRCWMKLEKKEKTQKIKNMINQTSNIVYHYTDMNALINILNKERIVLRASNCLYLNDAKEILEGIESIKRVENNTDITEGAFRSYYITSFSKLYDSLTMWGMYAANGFGCSIGFDLNVLGNYYHGYTHCIYGEKNIDQHLNSFLKLCRNGSYVSFPTNGKSSVIKKTEKMISDLVINQYITTCLSAKNENFKFENEIRCFYANHDCKKEVYFKTRNGVIIPYIEVEIPKEALKEIIIGPTNKQDLALQSILHFLSINGYDYKKISVKNSNVPYRG